MRPVLPTVTPGLRAIRGAGRLVRNFHASEPELAEIGETPVQVAAGLQLKALEWKDRVSIEMRKPESSRLETITRAADRVRRLFG
jgi:hypothetical protein